MMKYTNVITGAVIETNCAIAGENWRAGTPAAAPAEEKKPAPGRKKAQVEEDGQLRDAE